MYRVKFEKIHHENIEDAEKRLNGEIENKIGLRDIGWIDGFDFSIFIQNLLVSRMAISWILAILRMLIMYALIDCLTKLNAILGFGNGSL